MSSPDEYRRFAAECIELAKQATDPNDKARLMQMAQAWLDLADKRTLGKTQTNKPD
jgi:hypothetical protein